MKKNKKKIIIITVIVVLILVLLFLVYNSLFSSSNSTRYDGIENYELTKKEISSVKDKLNELDNVKSVDVYINSKIIKIILKLSEDIDLESIKTKANEVLSGLSEDNLEYYDVEIFVDSLNEESEVYPQIGYKFKTNSEFSW